VNAPPFRAEHIGSLLRPQKLLQDRSRVDECVVEAIRWQESLGLKVVTDGEFRRESWRLGFVSKVAGFARAEAWGNVDLQRDAARSVLSALPARGKVRRPRRLSRPRAILRRRSADLPG
jgi:5-methyltetrahydropteroyltriglutamate--homocysteine methyltransferase